VLRQELRGTGVYCTTIFPGRVDTPMIADLRIPWISAKIPAEAVARGILRAIHRRQAEVILPFQAKMLYFLTVISPNLADWAVRFFELQGRKV